MIMAAIERDLDILVAIARLDAQLTACRTELSRLPMKVAQAKTKLAEIEAREREAADHVEEMKKERRTLEQEVADNDEKIKRFRNQLMEVKTNKEYTAMLNEISHLENDTDGKEERLLILMDELDQQGADTNAYLETTAREKDELKTQISELEQRIQSLERDFGKLESEKPNVLKDLDVPLKKRYDRLLAKHRNFAVTNVEGEICQGCLSRVTPQTAVEVKLNDRIITCEACGRILVYYEA
jgi:predicted  nucleic acid-binding Zn-ribbon protein